MNALPAASFTKLLIAQKKDSKSLQYPALLPMLKTPGS
ncbi:MAG: hypothetical protein ACI9KN_001577 [Gammaproteobacteria bacterium]|jgi:hypothetical protein